MVLRLAALLLFLAVACGGRSARDADESGMAGTGATGEGAPNGGAAAATGGSDGMAGDGGAAGQPAACGFVSAAPDGDAPDGSAYAAPAVVWNRITWFVDAELAPPPELPSATSRDWARQIAESLLDRTAAFGAAAQGLTYSVRSWMPELADPTLVSLPLTAGHATLADVFATTPLMGAERRAGVLTDLGLLQSKPTISTRGAWIARHLLCSAVPASPEVGLLPAPDPNRTRRQELESSVSDPACAACHALIDPAGYSLENFDENGGFRLLDDGFPVDASGELRTPDDTVLRFSSVFDLAPQLGASCAVARCFAESLLGQALHDLGLRELSEQDAPDVDRIAAELVRSGFSLRELVLAIVQSRPFLRP